MNNAPATIEEALTDLCDLADLAAGAAAETSRRDDPHKYAALVRQFDNDEAAFRLTVDWLHHGRRRVALHAIGMQSGEPTAVEIFAWVLARPGAAGPGDEDAPPANERH